MTSEQVEEVAKGRVWTGARAADIGLVDALGGLDTATDLARELAGIEGEEPIKLDVFPKRRPFGIERAKPSSEPIREALALLSEFRTRAPVELRMQHDWAP
jgi:protease-4